MARNLNFKDNGEIRQLTGDVVKKKEEIVESFRSIRIIEEDGQPLAPVRITDLRQAIFVNRFELNQNPFQRFPIELLPQEEDVDLDN